MISIIVPLFNKENFILDTLQSILDQEYGDFEVIVVDDGSTDSSYVKVKSFSDTRITVVQQENAGVSTARNKGISLAKGEFITFLDADDIWYSNFLSEIMSLVQEFPHAGAYATSYEFFSELKGLHPTKYCNVPELGWRGYLTEYFSTLEGDPPVLTGSIVLRRSILEKIGLFAAGHQLGEDLELWARVALSTKIVWSNKVCLKYLKVDESSLTASAAISDSFILTETLEKYLEDRNISPESNETISGLRKALSRYYYIESRVYARTNKLSDARKAAFKSIKVKGRRSVLLWLLFLCLPTIVVKKWMWHRTRRVQ